MLLSLMILMILTITFTASTAMNPLTMGILILSLALLLALTFSISMSSWIAFLIFLIYIGGMLVMFAYFVAMMPDQIISSFYVILTMIMSFFSLLFILLMSNMKSPMIYMNINQMNILYTKMNVPILIMLALILLFTMVIVVKISSHNKGPLRPFQTYV